MFAAPGPCSSSNSGPVSSITARTALRVPIGEREQGLRPGRPLLAQALPPSPASPQTGSATNQRGRAPPKSHSCPRQLGSAPPAHTPPPAPEGAGPRSGGTQMAGGEGKGPPRCCLGVRGGKPPETRVTGRFPAHRQPERGGAPTSLRPGPAAREMTWFWAVYFSAINRKAVKGAPLVRSSGILLSPFLSLPPPHVPGRRECFLRQRPPPQPLSRIFRGLPHAGWGFRAWKSLLSREQRETPPPGPRATKDAVRGQGQGG